MASSVSQAAAALQVVHLPATAGVACQLSRDFTVTNPSTSHNCLGGGSGFFTSFLTPATLNLRAPNGNSHLLLRPSHPGSQRKLIGIRKAVPRASRDRDDFDFSGGPIDDVRPTFSREAYKIPPPDPPKQFADNPRKRKGRPQVKPAQAIVGSVIAAGCSVALFNFVRDAYFFVAANPPVNRAPYHLEGDINALICTCVAGFGGFAVLLFAVNSAGLALLAVKGLSSPASDAAGDE